MQHPGMPSAGSHLIGVRLATREVRLDPLEGIVQDHGADQGSPGEQEPPILVHQRPPASRAQSRGSVALSIFLLRLLGCMLRLCCKSQSPRPGLSF